MLHRLWTLSLTLTLLLAPQSAPAADRQGDGVMILISLDGLANFYLDDPRADLPTLRRLIAEGARADGMVPVFPTVTWPNHTTIVTGVVPAKHGVIGNNYIDRATQERVGLILDPVYAKTEVVKCPTIYDVAHEAGLTTAAVTWPCTRSAPTLDYNSPDMTNVEDWQKYGTASWINELREAGEPVDQYGKWFRAPTGGPPRDWLYTRMARDVIEHRQPDLALIHLVDVDHAQHVTGPRSPETYFALRFADDRVRELLEAIERSPYKDRVTLCVCSDHGFFRVEKEIHPNILLRQMGLVELEGKTVKRKQVWSMASAGAAAVYLFDEQPSPELASRVREALGSIEGVAEVFGPEDFDRIGQPTRDEDPRGADFWLSAKEGYMFGDDAAGESVVVPLASPVGTHGYYQDQPDMLATCIFWGRGVQPGTNLGKINNLDLAPTMAKVLGLELPNTEGKVLDAVVGP